MLIHILAMIAVFFCGWYAGRNYHYMRALRDVQKMLHDEVAKRNL